MRILEPAPGERILDACAGMGTKTVQIAEHLRRRGTILAADASAERIAELEHGARERAVLDSDLELRTLVADLTAAAEPSPDPFDAVLLDAPCTGLGNLARHPELRQTAEAAAVGERAALQATLLRRCAALVRPGGRLVYAVCSLEPEEGPAIIAAFLADATAAADFTLTAQRSWTPEREHSDGFWLARLDRRSP